MSSSEGENFDIDNVDTSDSDDYAPDAKKAPKAPTKPKPIPKVSKPAVGLKSGVVKSKTTAKKKVLADHDDNAEDSAMDVDVDKGVSDDEGGPSVPKVTVNGKKKTASETYTKLSQLEHILKRPDSYIGSVETITQNMWAFDSDTNRMVLRDVKYVPGFFKIVDEILVNAADNKINDPSMDCLKVNVDVESCTISVYNNGRGIPIEMHSTEKMYIPELIFGHLLSSSNYDDDEKKLTGGRNGYGAKLANIYSHEFTIETADKNTGQKYKQTWTDNMSKVGKAKITKNAKGEEWTRVTFKPDLARFGMDTIDDDTAALLKKRVYDMAGTVKDIKVFLNDKRLQIKNFKTYVDMYLSSFAAEAAENSGGAAQVKPTMIYEQVGKRWEVAFAVSDGTFQHVSFANSIATTKGGTHVTLIADQIAKNLVTAIGKKNKAATVKGAQIKNHMWIFVNCLIENPTFDSQTKEQLTLTASKFGTKPTLSEDFMKKVQKSSIIDHVLNWAKFKADQQIKKTDGSKRNRLTGMPKLADANNAGTKKASDCTLILTEGDSAKTLAVAGLGVVGRDNFGVFPLRGKLLNVREAKHDQIMKNEEIQNIKKIMGLQHNKDYSNTSSLRYGQLMIMTDQDYDGSHIKGLLINFLDHFFPSLLKQPKFLVEFVTPIVRVKKGKQHIDFFTIPEYEKWLEVTPDSHKWIPKYYKGLGTSLDSDARDYFSDMKKHMIPFAPTQEGDKELIELAFSKKKADERKEWLRLFQPGTFLDHTKSPIPISDFINRELILFSMADNIRSIPSIADGLKPGQRKVIWGCFHRKLKSEIKVAQLVGYVSEKAAYHHGEVSLAATIVNLAQDYVGSNNINLLMPNGQYGTRDAGGKDHAAARYIFTEPSPLTRIIYHPADDPLLRYLKDDNQMVEPEWYLSILPLILVNGADGIGTGWSTSIPCYNPIDIVANIRRLMNDEEMVPMLPWWRGFKGEIKKVSEYKFDVTGVARKVNDTTIEITELPIHKWTQNYKVELEAMIGEKGDGVVKDYKEHHDNLNVHFVINMAAKDVQAAEEKGLIEYFKLISKINTSNMICFDFEGKIRKYNSPEAIIEEFYPVRLAYYQKRKDYLANELQIAFEKLTNQARFVQMIIEKELVVSNRKKADIVNELRKKKFRPFPKGPKAKAAGDVVEEGEEEEDAPAGESDYDYLLGMPIWSLTKEKIEKLRQQGRDKEAELLALLETTPTQVWNTDLDRFLAEWENNCKEWEAKSTQDSTGKVVKRKQTTLRKSIGGAGKQEDSEDDFKPTKTAAKSKKATETKRANTVAPKKKITDVDDKDEKPAPKKRAAATRQPLKVETDSESDIEVVEKAPPKKQPIKTVDIDSESEANIDAVPAKSKGKAKASPVSKRKSPAVENDNSDNSMYHKPSKKKRAMEDSDLYDEIPTAGPSKTAKKPVARQVSSTAKAAPSKKSKRVIASDDEDVDDDIMDLGESRAAAPAPKRAARAAPKTYVVDLSSEGDGGDDGDDSLFEDE